MLAADGLEKCVTDLAGPFNFAGRGFVFSNREGVIKVYSNVIDKLKLQNAVQLVRALSPLAVDVLARNKIQEDWDSLVWKYNQANAKLKDYVSSEGFQKVEGASEFKKSIQEGSIEFDLPKYVVE